MLKGFRDFVARGNVIDLAVGVIIGAAFGAIVDSLVKDLLAPIIGMIVNTPDFSGVKIGSVMVGNFINALIAFLLKAAGLYFFIVIPFNRLAARLAGAPAPNKQEMLLVEIRDLLKQQRK
jgi:large conductance mechanosensitive channel